MKLLKKLLLILFLSLILSSCQNAPPTAAKDELSRYEWTITDISGNPHGSVSFHDGKIKIADNLIDLTDDCLISENTLTVNSKNYGTVILHYTMSGNTLELEYLGKKIVLKKK